MLCLISRFCRLVSVAWKQKITSARVSLFHKTSSHFGTLERKKLCHRRRAENLHFYESVFCYQRQRAAEKMLIELASSFVVAATVRGEGEELRKITIELVLSMAKLYKDEKIKDLSFEEEEAKKSH